MSITPVLRIVAFMAVVTGQAPDEHARTDGEVSTRPEASGDGRVTVRWRAPEGCPEPAAVRARVHALLGLAAKDEPSADMELTADAEVRQHGAAWTAIVHIETAAGRRQREFSARRCEGIAEAFALLVAITLDPSAAGRAPTTRPEPSDASSASEPSEPPEASEPSEPPEPLRSTETPSPVPPSEPVTDPPAPEKTPVRFSLSGAFNGSVGALPGFAPGFQVGVGILHRRLRVELRAGYLAPRERVSEVDPAVIVRVDLWTIAGRGCGRFTRDTGRGWIELPVCGGVQFGGMRGSASGVATFGARTIPWIALEAGPMLMYAPISRVAVGLGLDLIVPLIHPVFEIENLGEQHRAAPVGAALTAGLEVRLP